MTTVSVIVAAWNAAKTIERCAESIMAQQKVSVELIIVDDCSADNTAHVVAELQKRYPQIIFFRNVVNGGPSIARNKALELATGEWIAVVDADDTIQPSRLHAMVEAAQQSHADIVFDDLALTRENQSGGAHKRLIGKAHAFRVQGEWAIGSYTALNKPYESPVVIGFLKPLFRRSFLEKHGLRYNGELYNSEDYILILECLIHGAKITYLDAALYDYYIYSSSLSGKFNPVAHQKLIDEERALLERMGDKLTAANKRAIESHIDSLICSGITNQLFTALKQQKPKQFLCALYADKRNAHVHLHRLAKAVWNKLSRGTTRGK